jgi:hypothetical protein
MTTLARVTLPTVSNIAADSVVNTFHFGEAGVAPPAPLTILTAIEDFYNGQTAGTGAVAMFLSGSLSRATNAVRVDFFDAEGPAGTSPVGSGSFTLLAPTVAEGLPDEVACCLSYRNGTDLSPMRRRRRGRVFLGPFTLQAATTNAYPIRPALSLQQIMAAAGTRLANNAAAVWVVFSAKDRPAPAPAKKPPQANDETYLITEGWVDNAFDTMRSRGPAPTARLLWT